MELRQLVQDGLPEDEARSAADLHHVDGCYMQRPGYGWGGQMPTDVE